MHLALSLGIVIWEWVEVNQVKKEGGTDRTAEAKSQRHKVALAIPLIVWWNDEMFGITGIQSTRCTVLVNEPIEVGN